MPVSPVLSARLHSFLPTTFAKNAEWLSSTALLVMSQICQLNAALVRSEHSSQLIEVSALSALLSSLTAQSVQTMRAT